MKKFHDDDSVRQRDCQSGRAPLAQSAATCCFLNSLASSDFAHSPATCLVATLRRFQTLVVAIQRTSDASAFSS